MFLILLDYVETYTTFLYTTIMLFYTIAFYSCVGQCIVFPLEHYGTLPPNMAQFSPVLIRYVGLYVLQRTNLTQVAQ